jgi:hypothetical protein
MEGISSKAETCASYTYIGHKGPIFMSACIFKAIKASSYNPIIHCVFAEIVECESNHVSGKDQFPQ